MNNSRLEWDEEAQAYRYNGRTAEQINQNISYKDETLSQMGVFEENAPDYKTDEVADNEELKQAQALGEKRDANVLTKLDNVMGYVSPVQNKEYEKLSVGESLKDAGQAVFNEMSHLWQAKEDETQYEARTQLAENLKYLYRYGAGAIGAGKLGWSLKAVGAATKGVKGLSFLSRVATGAGKAAEAILAPKLKVFNAAKTDTKLIVGSKKLAQIMSTGAISGMWGDFVTTRPDEGEGLIGDLLPNSDNPIVKFFQTDEADSGVEYRAKKAIEGIILGGFVNLGLHGLGRIASSVFEKLDWTKKLINAKTEDEVLIAAKNVDLADEKITNTTNAQDLIDKVSKAYNEAENKDLFNIGDLDLTQTEADEAAVILDRLRRGLESVPNEHGGTSTAVRNWREASEVSMEELRRQLTPEGGKSPDGINFMDNAVEDTLRERGVIRKAEQLVSLNDKGQLVTNNKLTDTIKLHYLNKWGLGTKANKVKIQWVDGTTSTGKEATSEIVYKNTKAGKEPAQINIKIDKNTANPYAVIRSELEHARDELMGTTPKDANVEGSGTHFSRYAGDNESEASFEYVKRKADKRAKTYTYKNKNENINGLDNGVKQVFNNKGELLAEIRYAPRGENFEIRMDNYGIEKGSARKALAELMRDYPDKTFYWEAINEQSLKSYNHFVEEYPELAKRVRFTDNRPATLLDNDLKSYYNNSKKGIINNAGSNRSEFEGGSEHNLSENYSQTDRVYSRENREYDEFGIPLSRGTVSEYSSSGLSNDAPPLNSNKSRTTENIERRFENQNRREIEPIGSRAKHITSNQQADNLLNEFVATTADKESISWKVSADNADEIYTKLMARGVRNLAGLREAFNKGDVDFVNWVVNKQLAAERLLGDLKAELRLTNADDIAKTNEILDSMTYLAKVSQQLGSAYGRGLNIQKFTNKARSIFATNSLAELGLDNLSDLLSMTIKNLDFTRSMIDNKQQLYKILFEHLDNTLFNEIMQDTAKREKLDGYLDLILRKQMTDTQAIKKVLVDFITPVRAEKIKKLVENTPDDKNLPKLMGGLNVKGEIGSYVIHNMLSSTGVPIANLVSGIANTISFPMEKIVAGIFANDKELGKQLTREGWATFKAFSDVMQDSLKLAFKAFETGDGKMIALGRSSVVDADADMFQGFRNIHDTSSPLAVLQNVHSFFTRVMGATDEFITQLNYRAIAKAKYLTEAEQIAASIGKAEDKEFVQQMADKRFVNAFQPNGRPIDTEIFAEARDITYQTPLSGKYWNAETKSYDKLKEQSWTMTVAESLTLAARKEPLLQVFIPFIRTPANIMQQNLEHNPFYAVLSPTQRNLIFGKNANPRQQTLARAKLATGTASVITATMLFAGGSVTGAAPSDKATRDALYKTGWQPYSIKVGDKYYSYSRIEPLASFLGFGANIGSLISSFNGDESKADNIGQYVRESAKAVVEGTFNKTTFGALAEQYTLLMDVLNGEKPIDQLAKQGQSFLPMSGLVRDLSTGLRTTQQTQPRCWQDILLNKYFKTGLGDYRRNVFGERQDVYNLIITTGKQSLGNQPEDEALIEMAEKGFTPSELTNTETGSSIKYKEFKDKYTGRSFYDAMMDEMETIELNGQTLREAVRELVTSEEYNSVPDGIGSQWNGEKDTKKVYLQAIFNEYKKAAKLEAIEKYGEDFANKDGLTAYEQMEQDREEIEQERLKARANQTIEDIRSFN